MTVLDTNDNSPVFLPHNRTARVSEDANVGHVVVTLGAIDSDIGNFGKVFYLLDGVNNDGTFVINESNVSYPTCVGVRTWGYSPLSATHFQTVK